MSQGAKKRKAEERSESELDISSGEKGNRHDESSHQASDLESSPGEEEEEMDQNQHAKFGRLLKRLMESPEKFKEEQHEYIRKFVAHVNKNPDLFPPEKIWGLERRVLVMERENYDLRREVDDLKSLQERENSSLREQVQDLKNLLEREILNTVGENAALREEVKEIRTRQRIDFERRAARERMSSSDSPLPLVRKSLDDSTANRNAGVGAALKEEIEPEWRIANSPLEQKSHGDSATGEKAGDGPSSKLKINLRTRQKANNENAKEGPSLYEKIERARRVANSAMTERESRGGSDGDEAPEVAPRRSNGDPQLRPNATLSKMPRDLHSLWREYRHGLDGRIPAKDFTAKERGRATHVYSKRNRVWRLISRLVNERGVRPDVAIDAIYNAYGNVSVSKIEKAIVADEKNGGHPDLR